MAKKAFPTFVRQVIVDRESTTDNVFFIENLGEGKSQLILDTSGLKTPGTEINASLLQRYEDAIAGIVDAFVKIINDQSDDDHFASAKAVYTFVNTNYASKNELETLSVKVSTNTTDINGLKTAVANCYTKDETYNKTEVNSLIDAIKQLEIVVVDELPTPSEETYKERKIYLYQPDGAATYEEYVIAKKNSEYILEKIGDTDIKLTNYYTKADTDKKLDEKQDNISDLETIRSGASAGATALQPDHTSQKLIFTLEDDTTVEVDVYVKEAAKNATK